MMSGNGQATYSALRYTLNTDPHYQVHFGVLFFPLYC